MPHPSDLIPEVDLLNLEGGSVRFLRGGSIGGPRLALGPYILSAPHYTDRHGWSDHIEAAPGELAVCIRPARIDTEMAQWAIGSVGALLADPVVGAVLRDLARAGYRTSIQGRMVVLVEGPKTNVYFSPPHEHPVVVIMVSPIAVLTISRSGG